MNHWKRTETILGWSLVALAVILGLYSCCQQSPNATEEEFFSPTNLYENTPVALYIVDERIPEQDVVEASDFWKTTAGRELFILNGEPTTYKVNIQIGRVKDGDLGRSFLGSQICTINLVDENVGPQLIAHELGHCIGFHHTLNEGSIMDHCVPGEFNFLEEQAELLSGG